MRDTGNKYTDRMVRRLLGRAWLGILSLALAVSAACGPGASPSAADQAALERVRREFGTVEVELERPVYVRARMRSRAAVPQPEMERLYTAFFFSPDGRRRDTRFVYLNVYDAEGRFAYQLWYDEKARAFVRGRTDHY